VVAEAAPPEAALELAEDRLKGAQTDVARLQQEVAEARRFAALLWETGAPLEELVLEALERLGCAVTRPGAKGKEDGRAVDPNGVSWTVEVKGREGGVKQDDVKAAHAHETEALDLGTWEGRALLVVNTHRLLPPGVREVALPSNAEDLAQRWSVPILLTSQLLDGLNAVHTGSFDPAAFWKTVAESKGLVDLTT
jgi:hypothetical protein